MVVAFSYHGVPRLVEVEDMSTGRFSELLQGTELERDGIVSMQFKSFAMDDIEDLREAEDV